MDRRARGKLARRKDRQRQRVKTLVEKSTKALGPAWATVEYADNRGYQIVGLHKTKEIADELARIGTLRALDSAAYVWGSPYAVVFVAEVEDHEKFTRDTPYFATLRCPGHQTVALWNTQEEADAAVDAESQEWKPLGGPVQLVSAHFADLDDVSFLQKQAALTSAPADNSAAAAADNSAAAAADNSAAAAAADNSAAAAAKKSGECNSD